MIDALVASLGADPDEPGDEAVALRPLLESDSFRASGAALPIATGLDARGHPHVFDLADAPHLLIGGTTGSGKSVLVHVALVSLLVRHPPTSLRLLLVDTKRLELGPYDALPHLRHRVVFEPSEAVQLLKWAVLESSARTALLAENGSPSLDDFNRHVRAMATACGSDLRRPRAADQPFEDLAYDGGTLPFIVVDDLAEVLEKPGAAAVLEQIVESGHTVGIHLICVTQRPATSRLATSLATRFPTRVSFRLPATSDSRAILGRPGAERLPGVGTMLLVSPTAPDGATVRGAYVSPDAVDRVVACCRKGPPGDAASREAEPDALSMVAAAEAASSVGDGEAAIDADSEDDDPLLREAAELVVHRGEASTSLLQRTFGLGHGRAARLLDALQRAGVVAPASGRGPREVLVGLDELGASLDERLVSSPGRGRPHVGPTRAASRAPQARSGAPSPVPGAIPSPPPPPPAPTLPLIDRILRFLGG